MVVFTCNHCGESLQKPKVEKHYSFVCRRNKFLTCVDCLKDFNGEEYSAHVKCITEEERYAAKGTYKNGIVKKGEVKQEQWSDMIRSILNDNTNLKPKCKNLLNHIVNFTNVPRKKPKFMNFMKNTMGGRVDNATVEEVWNVIEEHKKKVTPVENSVKKTETTESNNQNGNLKRKNTESEDTDNKSSKKIKSVDLSDKNDTTDNGEDTATTFQIKDEILKVLNKKGSISLTKLQKKIFKKYKACKEEVDSEKFEKRFNKKLKKISNIVIEDDVVSIKNE
ncbi:cell growth-regulating nucleolar protein [Coccinella septempunctata]|uniref:cell growth-regulating nucleolar protein n=1 Tax=Coccinella septempunctata TaxID=41139 RepID=UPI001D063E08|nr:cell growth-regulating nucleolar protein [Coccinella septempunctata]